MSKKEKLKASERYEKEYKYGLKHQTVLQFLNTICRKIVLQSDLTKVLIESKYCGGSSSASRLIQNLEANKLIMRYPDGKGKMLIQIRKLGILVAENKEDMDKVKNINHKKVNDQEEKIKLIQYRIKYFLNHYIIEQRMTLNDAMHEVQHKVGNTFATDTIKTYRALYNFSQKNKVKKEVEKHIENIEAMNKKRAFSTPNSKVEAPSVTQLNTLDSFARKDIFLSSIIKTIDNQLVANVVLFNYATEITPSRIESLKLFHEMLQEIGIHSMSTTIISRSKVASETSLRRFKKKDKTSLVAFAYFENYKLIYSNKCKTANDLVLELNERAEELKLLNEQKQERERLEREQLMKYSQIDFDSILKDYRLKKWLKDNLKTEGFAKNIDYIIKYKDDFNRLESDFEKLFIERKGVHKMDYLDLNYAAFMEYAKIDFEHLRKAHRTYLDLRNRFLLNPEVKSFKQMSVTFDKESTGLSIKSTDNIYRK